ncbi:Putative exported protein [Cronobacter muytjensii 530]
MKFYFRHIFPSDSSQSADSPRLILFFESFSDLPFVSSIAKLLLIAQPGGIPVNKSMLAGIGIGVVAALGVAAVASLDVFTPSPKYAQVVSATPIKETVKTPRQECRNVTVTHRRPVQDENRLTGSVLGAVAGGVIGHQFGGGRGKDVATVVGALGGGYAGNQIQGHLQESDTYTTTQQRCKTVYDKSEKMLGYDVTYRIGEEQGKIRMDNDPGSRIPLDSNGQLVLNQKT